MVVLQVNPKLQILLSVPPAKKVSLPEQVLKAGVKTRMVLG